MFIFAVIFAILQKTKPIGDITGINALIAVVVGILAILSKDVIAIVDYMVPWFILLLIFVVLVLTVYKMMGAEDKNFSNLIRTDKGVQWLILALSIIIIISSISHVYGQRLTSEDGSNVSAPVSVSSDDGTGSGDFQANMKNIFFHPKIIGLIFIMLIAVFAVALLTLAPGSK